MSDDFHEKNNVLHEDGSRGTSQFVTLYVNDQLFGIPILQVQDVLGPQRLTPIPPRPETGGRRVELARPYRDSD